MVGYIHSKESFGTVDGPGIRFVIFMQGCPFRCLYCHNPDTWLERGGEKMTAEELIRRYKHVGAFYRTGGLTVSGGEPLMQLDFLIELFSLAKKEGIHTCIDTSGATFCLDEEYLKKLDAVLANTDLVMLDLKLMDSDGHKRLTGYSNENVLAFARYLDQKNIPVWIRRVVVKGYTDSKEEHERLGSFMATLKNVRALDVIPYHAMAELKYTGLGLKYRLEGVPACSIEEAKAARREILQAMKKAKENIENE